VRLPASWSLQVLHDVSIPLRRTQFKVGAPAADAVRAAVAKPPQAEQLGQRSEAGFPVFIFIPGVMGSRLRGLTKATGRVYDCVEH